MAPALIRVKTPRNPGMPGSGAVAATLAMVSQVRCTFERDGVGWKVGVPHAWVGAVRKAWVGLEGNMGAPWRLFPVMSAWRACVGAHLRGAACPVLC